MNVQTRSGEAPGAARCPGDTPRDIVGRDLAPPPEVLTTESYSFLGDEDIPFERYTSQAFFDQEIEKMWPKVWQWACRLEHIPEVGDNYVYDVGPYSILVVRHGEGAEDIKAYHNSCMHRGTQLKPSHSQGNSQKLRCPFHGWEWNLDGSIGDIPCRWDFPKVTDDDYRLPEVQVGLWGGFVFINMDEGAEPLTDYLGVLPEHFALWPPEDRHIAMHIQKTLPANWKASQEAFLEAYHSMETHPQTVPFSGTMNAQYDTYGANVNRFFHNFGVADITCKTEMTEQGIVDETGLAPEGTKLPDGMSARTFFAQSMRQQAIQENGVDLSEFSASEIIDSIQYHLFPNMFLFPGIFLPMVYRFRPNGMDPDSAIFDLLFMKVNGEGDENREPPEPVKIGVEESYKVVPGVSDFLGLIYDQDTGNLAMQQRGFKAARKGGQTLGNYQEVRIRRIHQTLDAYLSA